MFSQLSRYYHRNVVRPMHDTRFSHLKVATLIYQYSDRKRLLNPKVMRVVTFGTLRQVIEILQVR